MSVDLLVWNARLADGREGISILVKDGRIVDIGVNLEAEAEETIDAKGNLVTPPFIDSHFHLDSTLSLGKPRLNRSGTLLEGIDLWGELKPQLTADVILERTRKLVTWSIARGTLAIRSHVDVSDPTLINVEALLQLREEMKEYVDIQLVAFPQDGVFRSPGTEERLKRALDMGVDVVGGIPHFERTMEDGRLSVGTLCRIAAERGLMVDMHCDETDDPMSRHVETLAAETIRHGLQDRVAGSHLTSMHSMDNYYVSKLIPLMAEARLHAIPNPLINIALQGRHDIYPKRRGMTRVRELLAAGVNVSFGHDCVMDPWYSLGSHDMLEVAHMALHVGHMTGIDEMKAMFDCVTASAAKTLQLDGYGLEKGCNADFVVVDARDPVEALRLKPPRLYVVRRGNILSRGKPLVSDLRLDGTSFEVDFRD